MALDLIYLQSVPGVLTVVEFLLSFMVMVCVAAANHHCCGHGFVYFVSIFALFETLLMILAHVFQLFRNLSTRMILLINAAVSSFFCLFYFVAMCVSAAAASHYRIYAGNSSSAFAAAAVLSTIACATFGTHLATVLGAYRGVNTAGGAPPPTTTYSDTPPAVGP